MFISGLEIDAALRMSEAKKRGHRAVDLEPMLGASLGDESAGLALQLVEAQASSFPFLVDSTLADARLRQRTGTTLVAIARAGGTLVHSPGAKETILPGDRLFLIGNEEQIASFRGDPPSRVGAAACQYLPGLAVRRGGHPSVAEGRSGVRGALVVVVLDRPR